VGLLSRMTTLRLSSSRLHLEVCFSGLFFSEISLYSNCSDGVFIHRILDEEDMTTKAPASVAEYPPESLEKIAYTAVDGIPTQEPNDRYRLGYNVWMWLVDRKGTLAQAIHTAGSRLHLPEEEVVRTVSQRLKDKGIQM
jgi:hypothetical protein